MAKGFTVKANTPQKQSKKKEEWDIAAIKERIKVSQLYFVSLGEEYHISF